jgi:hypothetical protein
MKTIILSTLLLALTSCHTYIDFVYKGTEVIEYQDTIRFEPIHLHYEEIGEPKCYFIELNKIPYTQVYIIENWIVRKRRKFKSNV